jgi:hypothetical protein
MTTTFIKEQTTRSATMFKQISLILMLSLLTLMLVACAETAQPEAAPANPQTTESQASEASATIQISNEASAGELSTESDETGPPLTYPIVDTGQGTCYDDSGPIDCPAEGEAFYGQDAQISGNTPSYTDNGDGTITDNVTGLVWEQSADTDGDGDIGADDKLSYEASLTYCENLSLAGYDDWQLPTIKQLYSLMNFNGTDPSGYEDTDTSGLIPFIDTDYFDFAYGDTDARERIIDSQYASSNLYAGDAYEELLFGVNFADGRIKGYGLTLHGQDKTFTVACIRENNIYGVNDFVDNGDSTITDNATGLMWTQNDSGSETPDGLNWEEALAYVEAQNEANYLGYSDWRLPDIKELQGIVDYDRSPDTTDSAAIDPLFNATAITNEVGETDYAYYWSGTTHVNWTENPGDAAAYVSFGRAMGYFDDEWTDVHGAGSQKSDPKSGDPADWPTGNGPQGDAIHIYNFVRMVRDDVTETPDGDPGALESSDSAMAETDGQGPDIATAAEQLGVTEDELKAALGDPSKGVPDIKAAAEILGVTTEELKSAIGIGADEEAITIDAYTATFNGINFEITYELFSWADLPSDVVYERQPIESYTNADGTIHWYEAVYVETGNLNWYQAANLAQEAGGYLASITSEGENNFVFDLVSDEKYFWSFDEDGEHYGISIGPFLGGYQPKGSEEPDGGWSWLSGEEWNYTNWAVNLDDGVIDKDPRDGTQPNDSGDEVGSQPIMGFGEMNVPVPTWGDYMENVGTYGKTRLPGFSYGFIIEYESTPMAEESETAVSPTDTASEEGQPPADSQAPGPGAPGGGTGSPQMPDMAAAAAQLGITEEALMAALGEPGQGPPDFATAAATLGISEEALIAVLGIPEGRPEGPPSDGDPSPAGGPPPSN